jgi:chemotaxis protein methyltransferase CheR
MILERVNISDEQLKRLADVVHAHCGIHLHTGKKELVQARLARRLRVLGDISVDAYLSKLLNNPDDPEFDHLIDALSTNLTSFFRENAHFEHLGKTYLPELIAKRGASGSRKLRGWSAACSTGEEPYTMGITAFEALGSARSNWDVKILATDISRPVLEQARKGVYAFDRVEKIPSQYRATYFEPVRGSRSGELQVGSALRGAVRFANLNLMEPWPFDGPFDFVFCRNVMIYFDKPTQERLVNRIHDVLAPGGVFFTGHSESLTGVNHKFEYVLPTIYRKRG